MSLHESITTEMHRFINDHAECAILSPAALAAAAYEKFADDEVEPHIAYPGPALFLCVRQNVRRCCEGVTVLS